MPTYEYACRDCGEHLEVVQSFKDAPLTVCGACGGHLRKVFSAAGIIFKGSGYYVTDTRSKKGAASGGDSAKSRSAKSDSGDSSSSGSGDTSSSGSSSESGGGSSDKAASSSSTTKSSEAKSA